MPHKYNVYFIQQNLSMLKGNLDHTAFLCALILTVKGEKGARQERGLICVSLNKTSRKKLKFGYASSGPKVRFGILKTYLQTTCYMGLRIWNIFFVKHSFKETLITNIICCSHSVLPFFKVEFAW